MVKRYTHGDDDRLKGMMTPLATYAVTVHEFYSALMQAGFSEAQAIYLTGQRMQADARG